MHFWGLPALELDCRVVLCIFILYIEYGGLVGSTIRGGGIIDT